ncbi:MULTISPECIES: hypothetical protein [unclassified Microbacterium]|uniref:hypothetical protein n=1 Tax=unclassified Microbacterium TaxID=2609290 RepID=UPI0028830F5F|nr:MULTISPECIES: hypothetical protein [unclassified Microbacterium]
MTTETSARPENPYARAYANFLEQTAGHQLTVIVDDGLNRRLRVGAPDSNMWSWSVHTWDMHWAMVGDVANGYTFRRDTDMMAFFDNGSRSRRYKADGAPSVDFRYWAEKLAGRTDVRVYSAEKFLRLVTEHLEEDEDLGLEAQRIHAAIESVTKRVCARNGVDYDAYVAKLRAGEKGEALFDGIELDEDDDDEMEYFGQELPEQSPELRRTMLIEDARFYSETEASAHEWVQEHEDTFGSDAHWEWSFRDFDVHFLFACWAIELTVRLWREYEKTPEAIAHRAAVADTIKISDDALKAVLEIASRGLLKEIGAIDARHHYFPHELEEMNARFENAQLGIDALRAVQHARATSKAAETAHAA